jgi:hypothetical protein
MSSRAEPPETPQPEMPLRGHLHRATGAGHELMSKPKKGREHLPRLVVEAFQSFTAP